MEKCLSTGCLPYCQKSVRESLPPPPSQSRVQYVPYQRKVIDYQTKQSLEMVPKQRKIIQYEPYKYQEEIPYQKIVDDAYAVQIITQYLPKYYPQKTIQYIPVQRIEERIQYIPVERRIQHLPDQLKYPDRNCILETNRFRNKCDYRYDYKPGFYNYRRRYGYGRWY